MEIATRLLDPGNGSLPSSFMRHAYSTKLHSDVVLQAWGREYAAHRIILTFQSEYFQKKFLLYPDKTLRFNSSSSACTESKELESVMELEVGDDVTQVGFEYMLQYLYCCEGLFLTQENVFDVLNCAFFYQVQSLTDSCFAFLMDCISFNMFVACYRWAQRHYHGPQSDMMTQACKDYMAICMPREVEKWSDTFCYLEPSFIRDVLSSRNLAVSTEYDRYLLAKRIILKLRSVAQVTASACSLERQEDSFVPSDKNTQQKTSDAHVENMQQMLLCEAIEYAHMSPDERMQIRDEGLVPEEAMNQSLWYHEYLQRALSSPLCPPVLELSKTAATYWHKLHHPFTLLWNLKIGEIPSSNDFYNLPKYRGMGSIWKAYLHPCQKVFFIKRCRADESFKEGTIKDTRQEVVMELSFECWWSSGTCQGAVKKLSSHSRDPQIYKSGDLIYSGISITGDVLAKYDENDVVTFIAAITLSTLSL